MDMFRKSLYVTLIVVVTFCGCAVTLKPTVDLPTSVPRVQMTVGVYQSPEFRNYQQKAAIYDGPDAKIPLGSASATLFHELFPKAFEKVVWVESLPTITAGESPFSAVIEPQIDVFKFLLLHVGNYFQAWAEIHYAFTVYAPNGKVLASWTVNGVGESSGAGQYDTLGQAVDFAMQEAAWRFIPSLNDVPEAKRWLQGLPQEGVRAAEASQTTRLAPEFAKGAMLGTYPGVVAVSADTSYEPGSTHVHPRSKAGQWLSIRVLVENHGSHRLLLRRKDIALVGPDGTEINPLPTSTFAGAAKGRPIVTSGSYGPAIPILWPLQVAAMISDQLSAQRERRKLQAELVKDREMYISKELYDSTLTKGRSVQGCVYFFVPEGGASLDDLKLAVPVIDYDAATWYIVRLPLAPP